MNFEHQSATNEMIKTLVLHYRVAKGVAEFICGAVD